MAYVPFTRPYIMVNKDIKIKTLEMFKKFLNKNSNSNEDSIDSNTLVDLYNLYLICGLFHELQHFKQEMCLRKPSTFKTKLIKSNKIFICKNPKLYYKNHDLYYNEYDAVIESLVKTFNVIVNKCSGLDKSAIEIFNRIMANVIYHSYGNKYQSENESKNYDNFKSPISYLKYMSWFYDTPKEREILSICIKNLKKESPTEYLKLVNGFKVSEETMNLVKLVSSRKIFTSNILEEIKEIDKKNNR